MFSDTFLFSRGRALGVLTLGAALVTTVLPPANGEPIRGRPRVARRISEPALAFGNPLGVAYSPRAHAFLVAPAGGPSTLQSVTHMAEAAGVETFALAGADALNVAFDGHRGRLLARSGRWLLALSADEGGRLSRKAATRYDIAHLGVEKPAGISVDPRTGTLFLLDAAIPRLVQVNPTADGGLEAAAVSYRDLHEIPADGVQGVAFDPSSGHLFLLGGTQTLYETSSTGALLLTHDISDARLKSPGGVVVAPTGDQTDDPLAQSVYIADEGTRTMTGAIVELTFAPTATAEAVTTFQSSVVTMTLTSQWSPPAPDTSDVVYLPASNTLLVVDSEVEEMNIWRGVNEWETTLSGSVIDTANLARPSLGPGFTNEPTGVSVNPANRHLFYSDDDQKKVFEIDPGPDVLYHTADDIITSFSTSAFGSGDPEDVTYHPAEDVIYLSDGVNAEVYRLAPGPNGIFNGVPPAGDDQMTHFDVSNIVTDPECLTVDTENNHLYIGGSNDDIIQEISTTGTLLQTINISQANAFNIGGIGFGSGSDDPNAKRLYVVQRGVDNDSNSNENDGKLWQMTLPGGGPVNQAPLVSAGPNQTITLPASAILDGTVSDDGLPNPPGSVTTTWSKVSGPGTVTFGNASAVDTSASFSVSGTYVLRLTATDSVLSASDDLSVVVNSEPGGNQPPSVSAGPDQAVTLPNAAALDGTVTDDGLPNPPGAVTTTWSKLNGPGTVTFGNASAMDTTATFSVAGSYVLRLTADDGALSTSDDVTVTVNDAGQGTLSVVKRGAIHSSIDASSYSFAPVAASNDLLYVVFLSTSTGTAPAPSATGVSGAGLTFTEIGNPGGLLYSGSIGVRRIQAWRALASAGATTGSITVSLSGISTGMDAVLLEFSGADTSGTNGSGAIGQSATNMVTSGTSLTVPLGAFGNTSNRPLAFFSHRKNEATTPEPGYTELDDGSHTAPLMGAQCEWHVSAPDTTPSASWPTASAAGGFAIEVRSAGSLPGTNQAPVVSAGADQTITLPASAILDGTVSDDGLPNPPGSVTTTWSKVSGPGSVTFGDESAVDTTASFSATGSYVLRLTADDGAVSASDDVTVTVNGGGGGSAVAVVKKAVIHSSTDASVYSSPSVGASNNVLYVLFLNTAAGSVVAPAATSVSGAGLTFTEIGAPGGLLYATSPGVRRLQAWRALTNTGATTGSITVTLDGSSQSMDAVLLEFSGVEMSGTNGSGAIRQSATNKGYVTSLAVPLASFSSPNNRPVAFFSHRAEEATTEGAGYTELDDSSHAAPATGTECEWHASLAHTTPSASWLTEIGAGGFAIEVRASGSP